MLGNKKKVFLIITLLSFVQLQAQDSSAYVAPFIKKNKYLKYLFFQESTSQASLFSLKCQYLITPKPQVFRNGGLHFNLGLNIARFFSKKIIFGVCADFKFFPGFTKQYFSSQFIQDYNSQRVQYFNDELDSARAQILYNSINGIGDYRIKGNIILDFGISLSLFPQKYGGFLLEVKKGGASYPFYGGYSTTGLTNDKNPLTLDLNKNYIIEFSCKPYRFFNSRQLKIFDQKVYNIYKFIVISLYYERFNLKSAKFNGVDINHFVDQNFISKYSSNNYFGIKIGLALY